jgi:aldose sugar dehydrogenase
MTAATRSLARHPGVAVLALLVAAAADVVALAQDGKVHRAQDHAFRVVTVVDGLEHPWSMAFLPSGDMLVTERPGRLRIVREGTLLPDPVPGVPKVRVGRQGGLLDVVLHPQFEQNRLVYLSYSKSNADDTQGTTAVARGRFENDRLVDVQEIFEAQAWTQGRGHHGSRLAFDGQGYLFITVGDRMAMPSGNLERHPAQLLTDHYGTTLRLHDDGRVPQDNPFVGRTDALPEIWSYGHRNAQGLAVHPQNQQVWLNEHGPQGGDELNRVQPGRNYGWPVIGYGVQYGGARIHEGTHREGMEQPVHQWTPSIGVSGLMIYTGDRFPAWRGSLFNGGLKAGEERLARVTVDPAGKASEEVLLPGACRIRDVRQGRDGLIYLAVDDRGGKRTPIVRLEPVG